MTAKEFKEMFWDGEKMKMREVIVYINALKTRRDELIALLRQANNKKD